MAPVYFHYRNSLTDYDVFSYGGRAMVGHILGYHAGLHIYAQHSELQIGPLPLLVAGALSYLSRGMGQIVWLTLTYGCAFSVLRTAEHIAIQRGCVERRAQTTTIVAGAALLAAWTQVGRYGHLDEAAAIALIALATRFIHDGKCHWWLAPILIGTAAMCKPWAIAAAPMLLAGPPGRRLRSMFVTLGSAIVWWLPFIAADARTVDALRSFANVVMSRSTLRAFGFPVFHGAPKNSRLLEIVLGAALATWAALRGRWLAVPLVVLAARLLIEPRWFTYYGGAIMAAALLWDVGQDRRWPWMTLLVGALEFVVQFLAPATIGVVAHLAVIGAVAATVAVPNRRVRREVRPT
jgi:hypothetical protein